MPNFVSRKEIKAEKIEKKEEIWQSLESVSLGFCVYDRGKAANTLFCSY